MKNPQSTIRTPQFLWLVRHGESTANVARHKAETEGLLTIDFPEREADVPLSELGITQAIAVGKWFAAQDARPTVVYASPFARTRDTAQLIYENAGLKDAKFYLDERLREREMGIFDRLTWLGSETKYPEEFAKRVKIGKFYYRPPGGESWVDVILRLRSFIETDLSKLLDEKVLIVTHEVVIHCLRYLLENLTEAEILEINRTADIYNCAITSYEYEGVACALKLNNFRTNA